MMDDYICLFDLVNMSPLMLTAGSFNDPEFRFTTNFLNEKRIRTVRLYTNDKVKILFFDYSSNGHGRIFVRFTDHWGDYMKDAYYELQDSGESSGGGKWAFGIHNPWEKCIQENRLLLTKDRGTFIFGTSFEMLDRVELGDEFTDEINRGFVALPKDIRRLMFMYNLDDGGTLVADYPSYNYNHHDDLRVRILRPDLEVEELDVVRYDVYRDGGTVKAEFKNGDKTYYLYKPTPFREDSEHATLNDDIIIESSEERKKEVINLLGIMYDPHRDF